MKMDCFRCSKQVDEFNFFSLMKWPQKELDGLAAREGTLGKVVLPVWHNVMRKDIERFSPTLADKFGVSTSNGLEAVVQEILCVVHPEEEKSQKIPKLAKRDDEKRKKQTKETKRKIKKNALIAIAVVILVGVINL